MSTAVSVRGLRMSYGAADVLQGVDLEIRRGEIFTLLGPNGAGKTTTIEILEGFRKRSAGEVSVLGTDPEKATDAWRAKLGIVLQNWRDHSRWGTRELIVHLSEFYDAPHDPDELLTAVGLAEQAGQQVGRLSGGQRRRLDVALGIVGRPELLFLDEPTTGFDPEARNDFHRLLAKLAADDGMTVLLTTHDLVEAEKLAHRTAILAEGRIAVCGTPAELAQAVQAPSQVRWLEDGREQVMATPNPSQTAWELHRRFDGPVPGLEIRRPSLEESYLGLVGRNA
ncbi:ABC transporter ATP-binding protein [Planomonospora sp. ID67723]|uniref:ABC transporter ATP-binding protein n=1 Tax=Planomonospora sp. ID67723 TaxID=2738134 RepID=UPI0018C35A79|nr:ABC transporter ATP-binding protein [Planomonospora sp. ID67723]MBG0830488.1 ABC transporter ATP-binding protein [Planomonospora sp. ID67723]